MSRSSVIWIWGLCMFTIPPEIQAETLNQSPWIDRIMIMTSFNSFYTNLETKQNQPRIFGLVHDVPQLTLTLKGRYSIAHVGSAIKYYSLLLIHLTIWRKNNGKIFRIYTFVFSSGDHAKKTNCELCIHPLNNIPQDNYPPLPVPLSSARSTADVVCHTHIYNFSCSMINYCWYAA